MSDFSMCFSYVARYKDSSCPLPRKNKCSGDCFFSFCFFRGGYLRIEDTFLGFIVVLIPPKMAQGNTPLCFLANKKTLPGNGDNTWRALGESRYQKIHYQKIPSNTIHYQKYNTIQYQKRLKNHFMCFFPKMLTPY